MLTYPDISPIAFSIGSISIRWYGLMYILTFAIAYMLLQMRIEEQKLPIKKPKKEFAVDILFISILGVIFGGRLGYMLFYNLPFYLGNPAEILKIWNGGLSFHGGLIAIVIGLIYLVRKEKISFLKLTDTIVPIVPIGIFLVRIGNFINGELYGRITDSPLCMQFPNDPSNCRYPSQLIEALLEGLILFALLISLRKKITTSGILSWIFVAGYGAARFFAEFFREPDMQIGYFFGILTLGQIFSLAMIVCGLSGLYYSRHINRHIK